jgi:hypothetical protein
LVIFLLLALRGATPPAAAASDPARVLYAAAAAGDLEAFEAALEKARTAIDGMKLGDARNRLRRAIIVATDLDRVWRFDGPYWSEESLPDYYDRLSGEYPDFERFIVHYRVMDRSGLPLYPKQETREFLLRNLQQVNSRKRSS